MARKPKETVLNELSNSCRTRTRKFERSSSKEEHKENALASGAEEGRDKLR